MKSIIKLILYLGGILLLFSCQSQRNIAGKYTIIQHGKYPKIIPVTCYVELKSDSTFTYNYSIGFHRKVSTGFWKVEKNNKQIIINSFIQDLHNIPIIVTEAKSSYNSFPLIVFNNPLKLDTSVKWILNINDVDYPLNTDSLVLEKENIIKKIHLTGYITPIDSMHIIPIPLQYVIQSKQYNTIGSNSNVYRITFPSFVNYDIFYYKSLCNHLTWNRKALLFEGIKLKKE